MLAAQAELKHTSMGQAKDIDAAPDPYNCIMRCSCRSGIKKAGGRGRQHASTSDKWSDAGEFWVETQARQKAGVKSPRKECSEKRDLNAAASGQSIQVQQRQLLRASAERRDSGQGHRAAAGSGEEHLLDHRHATPADRAQRLSLLHQAEGAMPAVKGAL